MQLELVVGDIVKFQADAIVNAANKELLPGGGVCGAIGSAAGPRIHQATKRLYPNGCETGKAVYTESYDLNTCKYVIHAVGPIVPKNTNVTREAESKLISAYICSLKLADELDLSSVAFPILSIGIYNYPVKEGILAALNAILSYFVAVPSSNHKIMQMIESAGYVPSKLQTFSSATSINGALKRLLDFLLPRTRLVPIYSINSVNIYSFISQWENDAERKRVQRFLLLSDDISSSQLKEHERIKKQNERMNKPSLAEEENRKRAERRQSPQSQERNRLSQRKLRESNDKYRDSQNRSRLERETPVSRRHKSFVNRVRYHCRRLLFKPPERREASLDREVSEVINRQKEIRNVRRQESSNRVLSAVRRMRQPSIFGRIRRNIFNRLRSKSRPNSVLLNREKMIADVIHEQKLPEDPQKIHSDIILKLAINFFLMLPKSKLDKDFMSKVVLEVNTLYNNGLSTEKKIIVSLHHEQEKLRKAISLERKGREDMSLEQAIGGNKIHAMTHDKPRTGVYYAHDDLYGQKEIMEDKLEEEIAELNISFADSEVPSETMEEGMAIRPIINVEEPVEKVILMDETDVSFVERMDSSDEEMEDIVQKIEDKMVTEQENVDQGEGNVPNEEEEIVEITEYEIEKPEKPKTTNITYAKPCKCLLPDFDWAKRIQDSMSTLLEPDVDTLVKRLADIENCKRCFDVGVCPLEECTNILRLMRYLSPHLQHLRSILRRYFEIRRIVQYLYKWNYSLKNSDFNEVKNLLTTHSLAIGDKLAMKIKWKEDNHLEANVLAKFKNHYNNFIKSINNNEIHPCVCCTILFKREQVRRVSTRLPFLALINLQTDPNDSFDDQEIIICRECYSALSKGTFPVMWTGNGMELPIVPPELQNMNWLESVLIRKVRPIMSTFLLQAQTGRKVNQHKGIKGSVLHMPMHINSTVRHVVKQLPSLDCLNIVVNTTPKDQVKKLLKVDMGKVLKALKWLKNNNPIYANIVINQNANPVDDYVDKMYEEGDPALELEASTQKTQNTHIATQSSQSQGMHILTLQPNTQEVDHIAMVPVDPPAPDSLPSDLIYKLKDMKGAPISALEKGLDVQVFPDLFPTGTYGMHQIRNKTVSETKFMHRNLRSKDRRFATHQEYLIFSNNRADIKTIMGSVMMMTRKGYTGEAFIRSINDKDPNVDDILSTTFNQLRSHQHYWAEVKKELRTQIQYFGPPSFFLTLNPAEYEWTELLAYYRAIYPTVAYSSVSEFCTLDPVIFVRHFAKRVTAYYSEMLLRSNGVLGPVRHFWRRTEYQRRGAPHVHCFLWVNGAPRLGEATEEEIIAFIDQHITCRKPDPIREPNLALLVDKFQVHRQPCTATCKITYLQNKKKKTACRFGYPLQDSPATVLVEEKDIDDDPMKRKKSYNLRRKTDEVYHNAYNSILLMAWRGNIDLQFVGNLAPRIVDYITAYVGKAETKSILEEFSTARSTLSRSEILTFGLSFLKNREMGTPECADRLLGHPLHVSDMAVKFLNTNSTDKRMRKIKDTRLLSEGEKPTAENILDDYYPKRHKKLERFSLFNIAMYFNVVSKVPPQTRKAGDGYLISTSKKVTAAIDGTNKDIDDIEEEDEELAQDIEEQDIQELQANVEAVIQEEQVNVEAINDTNEKDIDNNTAEVKQPVKSDDAEPKISDKDTTNYPSITNVLFSDGFNTTDPDSPFFQHVPGQYFKIDGVNKWFCSRTKPLLPRIYWPSRDDPEVLDDWSRRVLLLFKPWRDENELKGDHTLYCDALEDYFNNIPDVTQQMIHKVIGAAEDMHAAIFEKRKEYVERQRIREEYGIEETDDFVELQIRTTTVEEVQKDESAMNNVQREVYNNVMAAVVSEDDYRRDNSKEHKPIRLFVSGVGGTGKSFLINALANRVTLDYSIPNREQQQPAVIVLAPTGLAALAVKGNTIHAALSIEIERQKLQKYKAIPPNRMTAAKVLFSNCRLIIIDEISMVSNVMLTKICLRLSEITGRPEAFGNMNIVVLGDLLQLPPVRANEVFSRVTFRDAKIFFMSNPTNIELWEELFTYRELTENMRQKDDLHYAQLLDRVRIGSPTDQDIIDLVSRMITSNDQEETMSEWPGEATLDQIVDLFLLIRQRDRNVVTLFPTKDKVEEFNNSVLERISDEIVEVIAIDKLIGKVRKDPVKRTRPYQQLGNRYYERDLEDLQPRSLYAYKNNNKEAPTDKEAGGLPAKLRLCTGCRVMLRRNIDVTKGLVNGAMGILDKIIIENDQVHMLDIKFDHLVNVYRLERQTVKFDMPGGTHQATRDQFPILVGFAMTVHKCQGISVDNVIADISDCFNNGMSYVALSRVRSLKGLYLSGFNPNKMTASLRSCAEYNRLRALCELPDLPPCNNLPPLAQLCRNAVKSRRYSTANTETMRPKKKAKIEEDQGKKNDRKITRKKIKTETLPLTDNHYYKFENRGTDCFANTNLWCLFKLPIIQQIAIDDPAYPICGYIKEIYEADKMIRQSCATIRNYVQGRYNMDFSVGQQCVSEFYEAMTDHMPPNIKKMVSLKRIEEATCMECTYELEKVEEDVPVVRLNRDYNRFKDCINSASDAYNDRRRCPQCKRRTECLIRAGYTVTPETQVMALYLPLLFNDASPNITGRDQLLNCFGGRWTLTSAIEYMDLSQKKDFGCGHYVAWIQDEQDWVVMNDSSGGKVIRKKNFKTGHNNIVMMFFSRA